MAGRAVGAPPGGKSSFEKLFQQGGVKEPDPNKPPSVHELFTASMRDEISHRQLEEMLAQLHGLHITPAAARLLAGPEPRFSEFQKALAQGDSSAFGGAGKPVARHDQAKAIITDNSGEAVPAPVVCPKKQHSDISNEAFVIRAAEIEKNLGARGDFARNPVGRTNRVSEGNPLAARGGEQAEFNEDDPRDMGNTATRMFVGGEIEAGEYETFLVKLGIQLTDDSELRKLINAHKQTGDGSFTKMSRVVQAELARLG